MALADCNKPVITNPCRKHCFSLAFRVHSKNSLSLKLNSARGWLVRASVGFCLRRRHRVDRSFPSARFPLSCPVAVSVSRCAAANGYLTSLPGAFPRFANQDAGSGKLDYQVTRSIT